ncbi:hypothetical protein VA7868_02329 [Vibrio aerogenes CECT 7868]|uniref:Uncharacterized protein n=1 Tax=Vibrio aerogenes CECT 7868 TaxID=1216006 RepID=A0A1M5Z5U3_9VIBR|nr:hypothetical protein [Vibrio aerogenes]SHI19647.1 hypothetical protein VA7868_02329 [Vibrio aerogenes CECT 7868]
MADFFSAFGHLIEDVFEQDAYQAGLSELPLEKLGKQAELWRYAIKSEGWHEETFDLVFRECYRDNVWQVLGGDDIQAQPIADSLFRYASFTNCHHTIRLMQAVLGMRPTGYMTPENIAYLNLIDEETFYRCFSSGKVALMPETLRHQLCELY